MTLFESDSYVPQGGTVYGFLDDSILKGRISAEAGEGRLAPRKITMSNVDHTEKKRRLSKHQVKSLEMSFGMDSKLEPEKKTQLAQQLDLQPRQVAIWFQNRRARCKTKQLEKEYINLKELYDTAITEKEELQTQILKMKVLLNMQEEDRRRLSEQQIEKDKPILKAEKEVEVKPAQLQCPDDAVSGLSSKTEQSEVTDAGSRDEEKDTRRSPHIEKLSIEMVSSSAPYIFVKGEESYVCPDEFFTHLEEQESLLCFNWGN